MCDNLERNVPVRTSQLRENKDLENMEDNWQFESGTSAHRDSGDLRKMDGLRDVRGRHNMEYQTGVGLISGKDAQDI